VTIAVIVKVNEGVVLAADSVTSYTVKDQSGKSIAERSYTGSEKVFQLCGGLPLGSSHLG
jgi:hypothetical protein